MTLITYLILYQNAPIQFRKPNQHKLLQLMILPDAFLTPLMQLDPSPRLPCIGHIQ